MDERKEEKTVANANFPGILICFILNRIRYEAMLMFPCSTLKNNRWKI